MTPDDWLLILNQPEYEWSSREDPRKGATEGDLESLTLWCGHLLPEDYMAFLRLTNGADIWHKAFGTIRIWPTHQIPHFSAVEGFDAIPGVMAFGDDTSEEVLAFDMQSRHAKRPYPVYCFDINTLHWGWDAAIHVADTFTDLVLLRQDLLHEVNKPQ